MMRQCLFIQQGNQIPGIPRTIKEFFLSKLLIGIAHQKPIPDKQKKEKRIRLKQSAPGLYILNPKRAL